MDSYNYNKKNEPIPSQAGYTAECTVNGDTMGVGALSSPSDIYHERLLFWIADTGNNRIVVATNDFSKALDFDTLTRPDGTTTKLKSPTGIFVSGGTQYITDSGNERIIVAGDGNKILLEIIKPNSVAYSISKTFVPQKVITDPNGNIYVTLNNITSGVAMFTPDGDFKGFFGADSVEKSSGEVMDYLESLFVSDEKKSRRIRNIPTGVSNFDTSGNFICTCSPASIRMLNPSGNDILASQDAVFGDFPPQYDTSGIIVQAFDFADVDVSGDYINCLDRNGRIFQYDTDGNLLFITDVDSKQSCAIESFENRIYVLDSVKNNITVLKETEFGQLVHQANSLTLDGYYSESLDLWQKVLEMDGNYIPAHKSLALAYLQNNEYKKSMYHAKLSYSQETYNKAFEGYRREFVETHLPPILALTVLTAFLLKKWRKKRLGRHKMEKKKTWTA